MSNPTTPIVEKVSTVRMNEDKSSYILLYLKDTVFLTQIDEDHDLAGFKKYKISPGSAFYNGVLDNEKYSLTMFINNEKHRVSIKAPNTFPGDAEKFLLEHAETIFNSLINQEMLDHTISFIKEKEGDPFLDLAPLSIFTKEALLIKLQEQQKKIQTHQHELEILAGKTDTLVAQLTQAPESSEVKKPRFKN